LGGFNFEGKRGKDAPRQDEYKFFIAAKDESGNYSESTEVTVQHPGIQKLDLQPQDVQGLISSIKIHLPKVYSENSQTVYPSSTKSEEKEILGYRLHVQEIDDSGNPIGDEEIIDYDVGSLGEDKTITYQNATGKSFEIQVGAYDSVYHPEHNPSLYEQIKSQIVTSSTFKVEPPDVSDALIEPNDLTTSLQNWNDNLEEKVTLKAGKEVDGEQIVGGIGLAYNSNENDIDVQVVADRFRLFDPDVEPNGKALFGVGTVDGTSQIFMNANEVTIAANDGNTDYTDGNFFVLDDEGLRINTSGLQLDKTGNAIFNGEVNAEQFSVGDWNTDASGSNLPEANADVTSNNPQYWDWIEGSKPEQNADKTAEHALDISHYGTSYPSNPATGWLCVRTDKSPVTLERYDGSYWNEVATFGADWNDVVGTDKPENNATYHADWTRVNDDGGKPVDNAKPNDFNLYEGTAADGNVVINDTGLYGYDDNNNIVFEINNFGNAKFGGELQAATGKLGNSNYYVDFNGTNLDINTQEFSVINGNAKFSGKLSAASGDFTELSSINGGVTIADAEWSANDIPEINVDYNNKNIKISPYTFEIKVNDSTKVRLNTNSINDSGSLNLNDGNGVEYFDVYRSSGISFIVVENLPTSPPSFTGAIWNDGGTLKVT